MIEEDYLLRMLENFFQSLQKRLNVAYSLENRFEQTVFDSLYEEYLGGEKEFFIENETKAILSYLEKQDGKISCVKSEILSELLFFEAKEIQDSPTQQEILHKSLALLEYSETESKTFSVRRMKRKEAIKELLALF